MVKIMKTNRLLLLILILFILSLGINSISAVSTDLNDTNVNNTVLTNSIDGNYISSQSTVDEALEMASDNEVWDSSSGQTIVVPFDAQHPNEVLLPKIQPAIDKANSGDTIIIQGSPVHCHLTINKTLTVLAEDGKTIDPCPHHVHEGLTQHGVFYITEGGSGSVIQGFNFINKDRAETPFSIYINGASDVTIAECSIDDKTLNVDKYTGIIIENSNNIRLSNLIINNTINGITIINSTNVDIFDCIINNNENYAITVLGDSKNINIANNSIINNGHSGINLSSADNINILNNFIKNNGLNDDDSGSGIYVNTNITKLVVKGNIFIQNGLHAIMYDYRCRNLNNENGADLLTDIDNNYFEGHSSMMIHHRIYVERSYGDIKYDSENDVYGNVGEGSYVDSKSYVYMKHALIFNDVPCGFTYYATGIPWTLTAPGNNGKYDLSLKLVISQVKNGLYQISIIDSNGNVAKDFNSVTIPVFLNDFSTVIPKNGDIYKNVSLVNGVGLADFRSIYSSFKSTGNIITAVFPGISDKVDNSYNVQLSVKDSNIPINPSTKLTASKLTTFPLSGKYLSAKLVDSKGKAISNQKVTFKFNGKTYTGKTNANGIVKVKVDLTSKKTYSVTICYAGSDDYKASKTTTKIVVKTGSKKSKITASAVKVKKNVKKTFKLKLTGAGKALKSQKVIVKLNGKSYTLKTNSKGIAKLSIKLSKVKKYKISMKFLGNADFKAISKTTTVTVSK